MEDFKKFFTPEMVALFESFDNATSMSEIDSLMTDFVNRKVDDDPEIKALKKGFEETDEELRSLLREEEMLLSKW